MSTTTNYRPEQFTDSGWDSGTPERKARFVNALIRFIDTGCPQARFTKTLYDGLYNHGYFGFIAHYDRHGFYAEQLSTPQRRGRFFHELMRDCRRDYHQQRPDIWTDVKRVLVDHYEQHPTPMLRSVGR